MSTLLFNNTMHRSPRLALALSALLCASVAAAAATKPPPAAQQPSDHGPAFAISGRLPSDQELADFETALNYTWADKWLLRQALVHPSWGEWNNARLAWIGDAVLQSTVSDLLFQSLPLETTTEGLHEARKARVRCTACAAGARALGLHRLLVVGRGFEGQEPRPHMLAEAFEAVWGSMHVDQGFDMRRVKQVYAALFPIKRTTKTGAA